MMRRHLRSLISVGLTSLLLAAGLVGFSGSAAAFGGEHGVLRLKGPGSVYSGSASFATLYATPGATKSFGFQVKNTGTSTAQYNLTVVDVFEACLTPCAPVVGVFAGSLVLTKLVSGPNGYFTAGIDPGKLATYTLKLTMAKTASPGDQVQFQLILSDTAGNTLDTESVGEVITKSKGTSDADEFVSSSGTAPTTTQPINAVSVTAPSVAIGGVAAFTVKLTNDSAVTGPIHYQLSSGQPACNSFFNVSVKAGSSDVSTLVAAGTYSTPPLAHGASTTLAVKITYLSFSGMCSSFGYRYWNSVAFVPSADTTTMYLIVNPAATN